ncbi:glycosyltransferase family 8 protein [Marinococcus halophilus]|uniref:glycosyltransferase family 8 protein n=1 Tax=Marinococcus halophilus TaxID=1371 RepID=UPI0015C4875D|nr:glycosyltransferase family 8 protein [Marinococcus halophilus]
MDHSQYYTVTSAADDNYAECLGVTLISLLNNTNQARRLSIQIIDGGISAGNKENLRQVADYFHTNINFVTIDRSQFNNIYLAEHENSYHISETAYYRLLLPHGLDSSIEKFLYIDCDTIVKTDVTALWEQELDDAVLAAAENFGGVDRFEALGIPYSSGYFNSGILMVNAWQWRRNRITEKVISFIQRNEDKMYYHDQDGLNAVLYSLRKELHPRWNTMTSMFTDKLPPDRYGKKVIEAISSPAIVHFTGPAKPWHRACPHPYKHDYKYYLMFFQSVVKSALPN